jgi:hypothetical protein
VEETSDMSVWERIRRFRGPSPEPDHPLSEREREARPPASAYEELAEAASGYLGAREPDFDQSTDS